MPLLLLLGGFGTGLVLGIKSNDLIKFVIIGGVAYYVITRNK